MKNREKLFRSSSFNRDLRHGPKLEQQLHQNEPWKQMKRELIETSNFIVWNIPWDSGARDNDDERIQDFFNFNYFFTKSVKNEVEVPPTK